MTIIKPTSQPAEKGESPPAAFGAKPELEQEPVEAPPNAGVEPRLDCLVKNDDDTALGDFAAKHRFARMVENGMSIIDALRNAELKLKRRDGYYLFEKYKTRGKSALIDMRRQRNTRQVRIMIPEVVDVILWWYFERPAAGLRAIAELAADTCRERNLPIPSEASVKKFLSNQAEGVKLARKGSRGMRDWARAGASVVTQDKTKFGGELYQGDHTPPDIWIRKKIDGSWEPFKVHLSAFLDDYTRVVPGFIVSTKYSDAWSISLLSKVAFSRNEVPELGVSGLPFNIESDCGADWISEAVQTCWEALGITPWIDHPYYPNSKGKVERWFKFLDSNCLRKLPGHFADVGVTLGAARKRVMEFLTLEQLRAEITKWIAEVYHHKVHGETGRKPIEHWEETVRYRPVENEDDLNILLLKYDKERTILNSGIRFALDGERHRYWAPSFDELWQRRVRIRYNPEDMTSVLIYCADSGEFLCEAWDMRAENAKYTYIDVKQSRKEERIRLSGISQRLPQYHKQTRETDRLVEQRKEWTEPRETAANLGELAELTDEENVDDLIAAMRERDRRPHR